MSRYAEILSRAWPEKTGDFPACFAFSIHKAGSSLMHLMISNVCAAARIPSLSIPDRLFMEGIFEKDWSHDRELLPWIREGVLYFGFRHLPEVLLEPEVELGRRRIALLVRDPRDALVSQYFSFGGRHVSHRLPEKNAEAFMQRAAQTSDLDIDEYVLRVARGYMLKLRNYRDNLNFANVLLRRYESIYFDKRGFLGEIFAHFGIAVDPAILDRVAAQNDVRPAQENPDKHIRKGLPGDHREKLRPETIARLNDIFRDVAAFYGYDLDAPAGPAVRPA